MFGIGNMFCGFFASSPSASPCFLGFPAPSREPAFLAPSREGVPRKGRGWATLFGVGWWEGVEKDPRLPVGLLDLRCTSSPYPSPTMWERVNWE